MKHLGVLFLLLAALLLVSPSTAGPPVHHATPWWHYDLTFWAPFDDARSPLRLLRGTGAFTFTRAHDATHTATYVHPDTGLLTVADNNQLRIEAAGALIEKSSRANLALASETLGDTDYWSRGLMTVDNNAGAGPSGTVTADKYIPNSGANSGYLQQHISPVATVAHTLSVWAKDGDFHWVRVSIWDGGHKPVWCNLTTGALGTVTSGVSGSVEGPVNGYYRCTVTRTMTGTDMYINFSFTDADNSSTATGDGSKGNLASGVQLEVGAFSSSYIGPTTSASITRNADVLTFPSSGNVADATGAISAQISIPYADTSGHWRFVEFATNHPTLAHHSTNVQYAYDGVNTLTGAAWNAAGQHMVGFSWDATTMKISLDGGTVYSGAHTAPWVGGTIKTGGLGTEIFHIKNLRVWSRTFTDAELQNILR